MFVFGHLGIGLKLAQPWGRRLSRKLILLGALLPDLIDKPIYYCLSWWTGRSGAALGLISGTRTFGHAAVTLLLATVTAAVFRLRWLAAICVGVATHLLLDNLGDRIFLGREFTARALAWPLLGWNFPSYPFQNAGQHLSQVKEPYFFVTECSGIAILAWEFWKIRRRREIARGIKSYRNARIRT